MRARSAIIAGYVATFFGAVPALLWTIGGRVDRLLHLAPFDVPALKALGALAALAGFGFMAWSMLSLSHRGRGLPISHLPPTRLVASGPYARMRHPIYVGYAAAFAGVAWIDGSIGRSTFSTLLLVLGSIAYALGPEETRLRRRFGQAYEAYAAEVAAFPWPFASIARLAWRRALPVVERLANRVVLFRLGPTVWVSYGAFAGLGAGLGLGVVHMLLRHEVPLGREALYLVGLTCAILSGARLVALLYRPGLLLTRPAVALRTVGFVSWGGYLGMFVAPFLLAPVVLPGRPDAWWLLDRTLVGALLCSAIGRVGCLTYGCCYGRCSAHGIEWAHPDAKVNRDEAGAGPRIPTQLLSAASALALVPVVLAVMPAARPGAATMIGAVAYCFARFGIECLRDDPRPCLGLTRGQLASAGGALVWMAILVGCKDGSPVVDAPRVAPTALGWAVVAAAASIVFTACSLHWQRVGRW